MLIYEKSTPHKVGILLFYFNEKVLFCPFQSGMILHLFFVTDSLLSRQHKKDILCIGQIISFRYNHFL